MTSCGVCVQFAGYQLYRGKRRGDLRILYECSGVWRDGLYSQSRGSSGLSVKRVSLLGYPGDLQWSQTASSLSITYPSQSADLLTSVLFRIEAK